MTVSRAALLPVAMVAAMVVAAVGLAVLWVGVATGGLLAAVDPAVDAWMVGARPPWLVEAARVASDVGQPAVMIALLVVVTAVLAWRTRAWSVVWSCALALVVLGVLDNGVKALVARPRPPLAWQAVPVHGLSFPSGHALWSAGVMLLIALAVRRPAVVTVAVVVAVVVAGSRVVLAVHYPSDVLAGWCLAVLADGLAVAAVARVAARRALTARPVDAPVA